MEILHQYLIVNNMKQIIPNKFQENYPNRVFAKPGFFETRFETRFFKLVFGKKKLCLRKRVFRIPCFTPKKKNIRVFEIRFFTKLLDTKFGGQKLMCTGLGQSLKISHKKWLKSGSGPCGIDASGLHLLIIIIFSPLCEELIKAFRKAFPCA